MQAIKVKLNAYVAVIPDESNPNHGNQDAIIKLEVYLVGFLSVSSWRSC